MSFVVMPSTNMEYNMLKYSIIYLLFFTCLLHSETKKEYIINREKHNFWITTGMGYAPKLYPKYPACSLAIIPTYQYGNNIINIRFSKVNELIWEGPQPSQYLYDISFLYGICRKEAFYYNSLSSGIGIIRGMRRGKFIPGSGESYEHEKIRFNTLGLSIDYQLFLITSSFSGLGLYAYTNINNKRSYWAILVCIQLGSINSYTNK